MKKSRYIEGTVNSLCFGRNKICLLSGPRQVGKTTFAKELLRPRSSGAYWNYDDIAFRRLWTKQPASLIPDAQSSDTKPLVVLDEIHKAKSWKRTIKGIYDTLASPVDILVTGSARLDVYQRGSDSLLGRYISFRLHPLSVGEIVGCKILSPDDLIEQLKGGHQQLNSEPADVLNQLLHYGGFPEPFYAQNTDFLNVWRRTRTEKIVREDLRDLSRLPELSQIEMLTSLLPERAAQPLSRQALREDLDVAHTTITRWLTYLSSLYYFFEIKPYSRRIKNSLRKEGKLYLWNSGEAPAGGARLENTIASHLLKACHFWTDSGKGLFELAYLKNKQRQEIDFLIIKDKQPWLPIEVKSQSLNLSPTWSVYLPQIKTPLGLQLVHKRDVNISRTVGTHQVQIISADRVLSLLP